MNSMFFECGGTFLRGNLRLCMDFKLELALNISTYLTFLLSAHYDGLIVKSDFLYYLEIKINLHCQRFAWVRLCWLSVY